MDQIYIPLEEGTVRIVELLQTHAGLQVIVMAPWHHYVDEVLWPAFDNVLPFDDPSVTFDLVGRKAKLSNGSNIWWKDYGCGGSDYIRIAGIEAHIAWLIAFTDAPSDERKTMRAARESLLCRLRAPGDYPKRLYITETA